MSIDAAEPVQTPPLAPDAAPETASRASAPRYPDFIIGGAPKCGTTSLHFILGQHPDIGLPDEEIHYFDADDPIVHPDFLFVAGGELEWFDARPSHAGNLAWYAARFEAHKDKAFVGEDSTTYLHSTVAADRIKALTPEARMIFMLRDPVARAYSQYWHLMMTARATCPFEEALWRFPNIILGSTYPDALRRYFDVFGRERVKVVLFEDFIRDKQATIDAVTDYIGAPRMEVREEASWFNKTNYPSSEGKQLWLNKLGSRVVRHRYRNHTGQRGGWREKLRSKTHYWWFRYANPIFLTSEKPPAMRPGTRDYLTRHLADRNAGLEGLLGRSLRDVWPTMRDGAAE